jgi:hypothetical protein
MISNSCMYTRYFHMTAILCEDHTVRVSVTDVGVVGTVWCGGDSRGNVRVSAVVVVHNSR